MRALFVVLLIFLLSESAVFAAIPLGVAQDSSSANIVLSPSSVTMNVDQSVPFTVTVPQNLQDNAIYQWYLNGVPVPGERYPSWAFTPTATGDYSISVGISTTTIAVNGTSNNSTATSYLQPAGMSNTAQVLVTTSSPTGSFGYSNSSSQAGGHGEQYMAVGSRFMLPVKANVTSISTSMGDNFVSYPNGTLIYSFAIYNDDKGLIGNLVAQTNQGSLTNTDPSVIVWHTLFFASPVRLNPGAYWLMELDNGSNGNAIMISANPYVNNALMVEASTGGITFPTTLESPIYTPGRAECMFASYTTGTPIISPTPTPTPPATTGNGATDWPMFHNDLAHSGYSTSTGPRTNQTLWSFPIGSGILSSPAVANGLVYVGSNKGAVYALDAATGMMIWSYQTGGAIYSSPAVADGVVYLGSWDKSVYALNATTGEKLWSYQTGSYVQSSPAVANGVVYIASYDANVYALNAATGSLLWSYATGSGAVGSSPAVVDGVVYIGDNAGNVYALDASNGAKLWSYKAGDTIYSSPAVAGDVVYIGADSSNNGSVYALNAVTGSLLWSYQTGNLWVYSSPAVTSGVVYVGSNAHLDQSGGSLYALNAYTGGLLWSYATGGEVYSSPAVANGVVYIGSEDNNMYALNASTGDKLWSFQTDGAVGWSSPAVADGVVYVGSADGILYAFGSYSTSTSTPTPSPTPTTVLATIDNGSIVDLSIRGNITSTQMSDATIATNQSAATTTVSFTVTGESGTIGFSNITIPKSDVPFGTTPTIYIDGQQASNQGFTQDANNYYVWYTTHFSTHQISIVFTTSSNSLSLLQVIYGVVTAVAIVAIVIVTLKLTIKDKVSKLAAGNDGHA
jgi:outer membrane protein assembly factor BamB